MPSLIEIGLAVDALILLDELTKVNEYIMHYFDTRIKSNTLHNSVFTDVLILHTRSKQICI
jgi:hypothetical protein